VASLSQGRTAAAQCGLFTHKSVPVIFEPPCTYIYIYIYILYHKVQLIVKGKLKILIVGKMDNLS